MKALELEWHATEDAYELADYVQSLVRIAYPELDKEQAVKNSTKDIR